MAVSGLVKRYGGIVAVNGVSVQAMPGRITAVLGPNGAGKTTLLRAVSGALRLDAGSVIVCGYDVSREPLKVKAVVGFVAERDMLFPELTVEDNVELAGKLHGIKGSELRERLRHVLEQMGLWELRRRRYGSLSKGLRRRTDIAAALVHDPPVLVLDEPTSGLDVMSAVSLRRIVRRFVREGRTVILSTHNIAEAMELSDAVYVIVRGRIVAAGSPGELRRRFGGREAVIVAEVEGDASLVASELAARGFRVSVEDSVLRIVGSVGDAVQHLVRVLDSKGLRLRSLAVRELTWEEVFERLLRTVERTEQRCKCPLSEV